MAESVVEWREVAPAITTGVLSVGRRNEAALVVGTIVPLLPDALDTEGIGVINGSTDGVWGMMDGSIVGRGATAPLLAAAGDITPAASAPDPVAAAPKATCRLRWLSCSWNLGVRGVGEAAGLDTDAAAAEDEDEEAPAAATAIEDEFA